MNLTGEFWNYFASIQFIQSPSLILEISSPHAFSVRSDVQGGKAELFCTYFVQNLPCIVIYGTKLHSITPFSHLSPWIFNVFIVVVFFLYWCRLRKMIQKQFEKTTFISLITLVSIQPCELQVRLTVSFCAVTFLPKIKGKMRYSCAKLIFSFWCNQICQEFILQNH